MGILSSIWRLIKKILMKIFKFIADLLGDWFLVILIVALIWFAPVIAAWLTSVGAPAFLISAFEFLALATPYVTAVGQWLWNGGASLLGSAWDAYKSLDIGWQAAVAVGAASILAPEETEAVVADAVDVAGDVIGAGVGAIAGGLSSSPWIMWAGVGLLAWWLLSSDHDNSRGQAAHPSLNEKES